MNKRNNIILAVVLVLIIGSILYLERPRQVELPSGERVDVGPTEEVRGRLAIGSEAPDFRLIDYQNQVHTLKDYRGKKILLNFWASWCPFCVEEMPLFQTIYEEFQDENFEIIAINRGESAETAQTFSDEMNLTYPLLLDSSDAVYAAYQGRSMPVSFMVDEHGMVMSIKFGPYNEAELRKALMDYFNLTTKSVVEEDMPYEGPGEELPVEAFKPAQPPKEEPVIEEPIIESSLKSTRSISTTDGVKHSVPLGDIRGGGPPKDGIPSIDNPKFVSIEEADEYIKDDGLGIALSLGGVDRFYPNQILVWHEIVNDKLGDKSALVTYCPLCGTGIVFEPTVKGKATEFGTSGKLWNSNLVMYDRQTDSYWSQVLGEAIVGEMTGTKLKLLPHDNVLYADWKKDFPNGEVLSRNTGQIRDYNRDPYGNYYTSPGFFFPVDNEDDRYFDKEPVFGVEIDNQFKVYPQSELLKSSGEFTDSFAGLDLKITFDKDKKTIDIRRADNGEEVVPTYGFWFSWISVHAGSEVWTAN